jgi:hypothetical protein
MKLYNVGDANFMSLHLMFRGEAMQQAVGQNQW